MEKIISLCERFLHMDVRYLAQGGFFLALINVSSAIVGFILTIAFANLIPQETYGTYRYILAVYALLGVFAFPGMDYALVRAASRNEDGAYLRAARIKLFAGFLGTTAGGIGGLWYGVHGNHTLALLFLIAGIAVPLLESMQLYGPFLNGKRRYGLWSALEIGVQIFSSLALLITLFFSQDIFLITTVYFMTTGGARAIAFFIALRGAARDQGTGGSELPRYGIHLTLYDIMGRSAAALDSLVLWHFLGPKEVALFALAIAIPIRLQSTLKISGTLALPKFTDRPMEEIARSLPRKMFFFGIAILMLCICYTLVAEPFFALFFQSYLPSVPYSQVMVFYCLSAITYPFSSYLIANKHTGGNYLITGASAGVKIIMLILCVPLWGIWGAVVSYLASSCMTICVVSFMMWRALRSKNVP